MKVVITKRFPLDLSEILSDFTVVQYDTEDGFDEEQMKAAVEDADGIICSLSDCVNRAVIDAAPSLKVIATYAVGYNNIDAAYAKEKGITVCNTPDILTESTAELGLGLLFAVARRISESERFTRERKFTGWTPSLFLGHDLFGKTLGIFGMGRIGEALARSVSGLNMNVIYHNRSRNTGAEERTGASLVPFETLVEESDFIVITSPLTPETKHRFTLDTFRKMKRSASIVNIGRGPVIKESDLAVALKEGLIFGAGLDVYEFEPEICEELFALDNVVLLPHIGSADIATRNGMAEMCANSVVTVLKEGGRPHNAL